jgi:hypothetical protein
MADKESILEIILKAKDAASANVQNLKSRIEELSSSAGKQGTIFSSLSDMVGKYKGIIVGAFAALGVGAIVSGIKEAIDTTVELGKEVYQLQRMTGMSAEASSELIAVADQMGISFGTVENAVVAIARKMGGLKGIEDMVTDASGKMVDVFEKYDIQIKNSDGATRSFSEIFSQIRDKIRNTSSETERLSIATQFFRSGAADLLPLLTMSAEQYKEIADEAHKYGIILTQENVTAVREYVMAHRDLDDVIQGAKISLGKELIPVIKDAIVWIKDNSANIKEWATNIGVFLVESCKAATGALNLLKGAAYAVAAGYMELYAGILLSIGQLEKAKTAHATAKGLLDESVKSIKLGVAAYSSLGDAAVKSAAKVKEGAEEQKKATVTYEDWIKSVVKGSQEYIDIKKNELKTIEANTAYEKALLDKSLADKTINMEEYLKRVKALNEQVLKSNLDIIDMEIENLKKAGVSKYKELEAAEERKKEIILKYKLDEVKAEADAQEKIKKIKEGELNAELEIFKAKLDLRMAMNDEAVRAGYMRESEAMQQKLDMLKEIMMQEISLTSKTAEEKEKIQLEYEKMAIESEAAIAEQKKKETQEAETFISELLNDRYRQDEVKRQEQLDQLNRFYEQGLISAEDYYDGLNKLDDQYTSEFKREMQDRTKQLNEYMSAIADRRQRLEDAISSMATESFDDVKKYISNWKEVLSVDINDMQDNIKQFMKQTTWTSYDTFWSATLYGRKMVEMIGTSIYDWARRVADYIQYVKGLMQSLREQIMSYQDQLDQLRGNEVAIIDRWHQTELAKLKDQYAKELLNTEEYQKALLLLEELYAEKRKQAAEQEAEEKTRLLEQQKEEAESASSGGGGGLGIAPASAFANFAQQIKDNIVQSLNMPELALQTIPTGGPSLVSTKNELDVTIELPSLDPEYMRRVFEDQIWPMLQKKLHLIGVNL